MRRTTSALCVAAVILCACSHENVKSEYMGTASMDENQVMQLLDQHGYTAISNLHENGQDWVGSATKDGRPVSFDIDKSGTIHSR
jgi:hypothetical protein